MSITDPYLSESFNDKIEAIRSKQLKTFGTLFDGATANGQCHRQFVTSAVGMFHVLRDPPLISFSTMSVSTCKTLR